LQSRVKEQIIHGHIYETIGDLQAAIKTFIEEYNQRWLLEKLGYLSPREARSAWERKSHAA